MKKGKENTGSTNINFLTSIGSANVFSASYSNKSFSTIYRSFHII